MPPRFTLSPSLIDYRPDRAESASFAEWLSFVVAMAPYDVGTYD